MSLSERQLRNWEKQKLVPPAEQYTSQDLQLLWMLISLRQKRIAPAKIRRILPAVRQKLAGASEPLTEFKVFTDGKRIGVQFAGVKMEPITGQLLLNFDAAEVHRMLSFPQKRQAEQARRAEGDRWFRQALEMEQTCQPPEEIVAAYLKALEFNPEYAGALVNIGTIYYHAKKWNEAEKYYRRALEADPNYALAHFNIGNLCDEAGDSAKALFHYSAALELDPSYADAHYNVAVLHQANGQLMRALRHWKIYLKLDPSGSWADIARRELARLTHTTVLEGHRKNG